MNIRNIANLCAVVFVLSLVAFPIVNLKSFFSVSMTFGEFVLDGFPPVGSRGFSMIFGAVLAAFGLLMNLIDLPRMGRICIAIGSGIGAIVYLQLLSYFNSMSEPMVIVQPGTGLWLGLLACAVGCFQVWFPDKSQISA
jgi:hypothetical protein